MIQKKGKLKIFFGYCAGVGKTYAMLQSAHERAKEGVDVVIGYIEKHDRSDTLKLMEGLPCIESLDIHYHGVLLHEFDLDKALLRHPDLILVDELAHSNASICRHSKRYSDIKELLHAGIDVYTSVNVQHLESLHDAVEAISGKHVNERVPDAIFDEADQVELIDIEPDELLRRLKEGKIYHQKQIKTALQNFFILDNLIALREIALRKCAQRVNLQSALLHRSFISEHILICLSPSPSNEKVIRTAARMATALFAQFSALYVETPQHEHLSKKERMTLENNMHLAEQFHANVISVYGEDIPSQIAEYAKISGISKLVLGRTYTKSSLFSKPALVDTLTQLAPQLDIYIIPDQQMSSESYHLKQIHQPFTLYSKDIFVTALILFFATCVNLIMFHFHVKESNLTMIYLLAVFLISYMTSCKFYGMISSVSIVLFYNFFFTVPRFSFEAYDSTYFFTFSMLFLIAIITNALTRKVKRQAKVNALQSHRLSILLEASQKLQQSNNIQDIAMVSCQSLFRLLHRTIIFYTIQNQKLQPPQIYHEQIDEYMEQLFLDPSEQIVANWVYTNNKRAGATTSTLPHAKALYYAIRNKQQVYAIVGISMVEEQPLAPFEKSVFTALLNEIAIALEPIYTS